MFCGGVNTEVTERVIEDNTRNISDIFKPPSKKSTTVTAHFKTLSQILDTITHSVGNSRAYFELDIVNKIVVFYDKHKNAFAKAKVRKYNHATETHAGAH